MTIKDSHYNKVLYKKINLVFAVCTGHLKSSTKVKCMDYSHKVQNWSNNYADHV